MMQSHLLQVFYKRFFADMYLYYDSYPLVIQIALVLTVVAFLATVISYSAILVRRLKGYLKERRLARINPVIDNILTEKVILNEDLADGKPVEEIQLDVSEFSTARFRKPWVRQALIDRLVSYRKNFAGEAGELLRRVYTEAELEKDSFKKMKSNRWDKKVHAMKELIAMDMSIADVNILPLTNSKNRELRAEARHAYIKLSKNEPFKFFDVVTEPLLLWDQLELYKIITSTQDIAIPNFARWVTYSDNKTVISFCLKLIVHYNQQEAIPAIIKLLDTKDHYLRADAINCLGKLKVEEVEGKLVNIYTHQPENCQLEILKALGRIESGNHIDFLKTEFLRSSSFDIRKNAARSIIRHKWMAQGLIDDLLETSSVENKQILKHCMNPLIKY